MKTLNQSDLYRAVRFLPFAVRDITKQYKLCVAGGYIRAQVLGETASDIDLFAANTEVAHEAYAALKEQWTQQGRKIREGKTDNALTLVGDNACVQFITRWTYPQAQDVIGSFDFTMCQGAVWWEGEPRNGVWVSQVADTFYEDIASRRLVYTSPQRNEDAGGSILRMRKFLGKDWHIDADNIARVLGRLLSNVKISQQMTDAPEAEREAWITKIVLGTLYEVDPNIKITGLDDMRGMEEAEREATRAEFIQQVAPEVAP